MEDQELLLSVAGSASICIYLYSIYPYILPDVAGSWNLCPGPHGLLMSFYADHGGSCQDWQQADGNCNLRGLSIVRDLHQSGPVTTSHCSRALQGTTCTLASQRHAPCPPYKHINCVDKAKFGGDIAHTKEIGILAVPRESSTCLGPWSIFCTPLYSATSKQDHPRFHKSSQAVQPSIKISTPVIRKNSSKTPSFCFGNEDTCTIDVEFAYIMVAPCPAVQPYSGPTKMLHMQIYFLPSSSAFPATQYSALLVCHGIRDVVLHAQRATDEDSQFLVWW